MTNNETNNMTAQEKIDFYLLSAKSYYNRYLIKMTDEQEIELRNMWLELPLDFNNTSFIYPLLDQGAKIPPYSCFTDDEIVTIVKWTVARFMSKINDLNGIDDEVE